ncbi:HIT family protein [Bacteroidia bacterium]|nr:HIT family protein [Bacteroidota bacterium]MDA8930413.1 HIT family protein [Bacteroidia bacterium]MDB4173450.1 HIT family protein [Bacteroidia bacterium]
MTIFEKIVAGEIPSYKVAETDDFLAFLDVFPLKEGHTLVIPKQALDYIYDLDDDTLARLNVFAKKVAKAIEQVIPCERIGVAVIGLEVPHTHIHLVPINSVADINFASPKIRVAEERMKEIAAQIAAKVKL